uniref:box C/D snoRNA protein 1 n=1 Tax=Myxine glutinosa TaxID=7769 RepID=UPI0035900D9F
MAAVVPGSDWQCNYENKEQKSSSEEERVRTKEQNELKAVRQDPEFKGESKAREERTKMCNRSRKEEEEEDEVLEGSETRLDNIVSIRDAKQRETQITWHTDEMKNGGNMVEQNETNVEYAEGMKNAKKERRSRMEGAEPMMCREHEERGMNNKTENPEDVKDGEYQTEERETQMEISEGRLTETEVKEDEGTSEKGRLEEESSCSKAKCEVCGNGELKYRCPGCSIRTCSALCVKNHKQGNGCTGVRDKTRFVSLNSFTESHLLSDYRFLEDVARVTDGLFRDRRMRAPSNQKFQALLRDKALKHDIDLRVMPFGFTKRKENFIFFHKKQGKIYWSMKLLFPQSGAEYLRKRIPEDQTLRSILTEYIDPKIADPIVRQRLKVYCATDSSSVQLFMKVEGQRADTVRYYKLEMDKTLVQNLARKTILEYPTVHVVLPSSAQAYHLLELPPAF